LFYNFVKQKNRLFLNSVISAVNKITVVNNGIVTLKLVLVENIDFNLV